MKKVSLYLSMVLSLLLVACGGSASSGENSTAGGAGSETVNYVAPQEIQTLDSTLVTDMNSANYLGHMQDGLYWEDDKNAVHPALATEAPDVSEDGLTYTIKMREDAQWSNGTPITAHDQVYAIQRLVDPEVAAPYAYLAENILNAKEVMAGELPVEEVGVTALDDYTVEIKLSVPTPYLPNLLAFPTFFPINQEFVESQGDNFGTSSDSIIASGPYTLDNWDTTQQTWTLNKNEDFYNAEETAIETIEVQVLKEVSTNVNLYESGQVDNAILSGELAIQYKDHPDAVPHEKARTYWIRFNNNIDSLNNQNLREAMDYAINNQELVDEVIATGSIPLTTLVPTNFIFNPETEEDFTEEVAIDPKYDVEKAGELWEQAKSELGEEEITLSLITDDEEHIKKISEYIQGQVQTAMPGLSIEIQNVPKKNRLDMEDNRDYDIILSSWAADFASGINFYELYHSSSPYNRGDYNNPEYDELIDLAKGEHANDAVATWEDFRNAQQLLSEETALVPLYQEVEIQLRNPRIQDITLRSVGNEFDFRTAHFSE